MAEPIAGEKKSLIKAAVDARTPVDGPHRPGQTSKKKVNKKEDSSEDPSYVVKKSEDPPRDVSKTYDPAKLKSKAMAFLNSSKIEGQEKEVLEEIMRDQKS
jgi:hypothetical protein